MGLMDKILSKSNSYQFYKSKYNILLRKDKKSQKKIKKLKEQAKKNKKEIKNYRKDIKFLRHELIDKENKIRHLEDK